MGEEDGEMVSDATQQALERLLLQREIEEFMSMEAELLDERRYDEWLELIADDIHYHMPQRRNVKFGEQDRENTSSEDEIGWFDEGKRILIGRVRQINTGIHWAEEPRSRVCHIVSNVQILSESPTEVNAKSRFIVYRNRVETETDFFVGKREDVLRRVEGSWKIARREITLDQNVLLAKNLTVFF